MKEIHLKDPWTFEWTLCTCYTTTPFHQSQARRTAGRRNVGFGLTVVLSSLDRIPTPASKERKKDASDQASDPGEVTQGAESSLLLEAS